MTSFETCKVPEASEISEETKELEKKVSGNLENQEDKKIAGEILSGFQPNCELKDEDDYNKAFQAAYNSKVDDLITKHFKTLEPDKINEIEQLKALKTQESEGKSPQELIASFREIKELIGTDVAEANKRNSEMIAQQTSAKQNQESQKQSDFMTQLKDAIKLQAENQEKTRQGNKEKIAHNNNAVKAEKEGADGYLESMLEKGALDAKA